jgi:competence protein ComEA
MRNLETLVRRILTSAWAPIFGKTLAGIAALGLLALFGSGALDGLIDATPAEARPTARPLGAPRSSTASPGATAPSAAVPMPNPSASASASASVAPPSAILPDGRLVLNEATAAQIDKLPGIGLKKAEAIVTLRTKLGGRFRKLEDLTRVRGIKRKALERLRPHLVLDRPPVSP